MRAPATLRGLSPLLLPLLLELLALLLLLLLVTLLPLAGRPTEAGAAAATTGEAGGANVTVARALLRARTLVEEGPAGGLNDRMGSSSSSPCCGSMLALLSGPPPCPLPRTSPGASLSRTSR